MSYQGRRPKFLQVRALEAAIPMTTNSSSGALNNVSVADSSAVRFSAATSITGFAAPSAPVDDGKSLIVANVSSAELTIVHQSTSSTAANRIDTGIDGDLTLAPGAAIELFYDTTTDRWRVKGGTGGGKGAGTGIKNYLQDWWDGTKSVGTVATTGDSAGVTDRSASIKQWATSDATKVTIEQDTGTLRGTKGYKITHVATGTAFIESPIFKMDPLDKGNANSDKPITISFDIGGLTSDTTWDIYVRTWTGAYVLEATKIATVGYEEQFALSPITSYLPAAPSATTYKRNFSVTFQPNTTSDYYSIVLNRVSGASTESFYINSLFVGPKLLVENNGDTKDALLVESSAIATRPKTVNDGVVERAIYPEPNYMAAWYMGNKKMPQVQDGIGNTIGASTRTASTLNRRKWGSSNTAQISIAQVLSNSSSSVLRSENGMGELRILSNSTGSNVFVESPLFYLSRMELGKPVMIQFDYANTNATQTHDVLIARYNSSGVLQEEISVNGGTGASTGTPASAALAKDGFVGKFTGFFIPSSTATDQYALRIRRIVGGSGDTIQISGLYIGPQRTTVGQAITDWQQYTPTFSGFGTVTNTSIWYQRRGNSLIVAGRFTLGTPAGSEARISLPSGLSLAGLTLGAHVGRWYVNEGTANTRKAGPLYIDTGTSTYVVFNSDDYTLAVSPFAAGLNGNNVTGTVGAICSVFFEVPISQWTSNVTMADRAVEEFASNSGMGDVNDSSSFAYGSNGSPLPGVAYSTLRSKTVRFQTPILPTDVLTLEIQYLGRWTPLMGNEISGAVAISPWIRQGGAGSTYGITIQRCDSVSTDVQVGFGRYALNSSGTYGAAGDDWGVSSGSMRWRVRKVSGGSVVGFPVGARNVVGDTTGTAVPTGFIGEQKIAQQLSFTNTAANNVWGDGASIVLTPGTWDLSSFITFTLNGATMTYTNHGISSTSGNSSAGLSQAENFVSNNPPTANYDSAQSIPHYVVNVTSNTTYYLKLRVGFSAGTPQWMGTLRAIRIA